MEDEEKIMELEMELYDQDRIHHFVIRQAGRLIGDLKPSGRAADAFRFY